MALKGLKQRTFSHPAPGFQLEGLLALRSLPRDEQQPDRIGRGLSGRASATTGLRGHHPLRGGQTGCH